MNILKLKENSNKLISNNNLNNKDIITESYTVNNRLITNSATNNLLNELKLALSECISYYFSVAFINFSGVQLLLDSLKEANDRNVKGKIITSTYLNFTEAKALEKLNDFENIDLNIFVTNDNLGFHTKAYIFENINDFKIIIGSSNITQSALKSNVEWNVLTISKKDDLFLNDILEEYNSLWNKTDSVDNSFIENYNSYIEKIKNKIPNKILPFINYEKIKPNSMQKEALNNLIRIRNANETRALAIAATGTGKTYMAAFDVLNFNPKRMLFIVHREDILKNAKNTFEKLIPNKNKTLGLLTGNSKDYTSDYIFSTNLSLVNSLDKFSPKDFDYIVIDEAHHASSDTYKKILNYFKPQFILGMTATPERCDNENIFEIFHENVAVEIRLREALEENLIVPFHYFGITDIDAVDLSNINIDDIQELSKRLSINKRVHFIIEKMKFYGHDGNKRKCIGFCVNKNHAKYMSDKFNENGIKSTYLTSDNSVNERINAVNKLQSEKEDLEVIFTVDLFNEGIDIPSINTILMLRPTSSPTIFVQQLGRGLRKHNSKEFLTLLDFIGNHNRTFLIAIALNGSRYYDKDSLKVAVKTDFSNITGPTNIQMDKISKERILNQLDTENFNSLKYLKEEYFNFKSMNGNKFSFLLTDYLKFDNCVDPIKFIKKEKNYISFLSKVEKNLDLDFYLKDDYFIKTLNFLSNMLPLKRPYEFIILKELLYTNSLSINDCVLKVKKYLDYVSEEDILHSFKYLNGDFSDSVIIKNNPFLITLENDKIYSTLNFEKIKLNKKLKLIIEDTLNYGLLKYSFYYGSKYYGMPFLKLYSQYQMVDVALLSNYNKTLSAFRGSGLLTNKNDFFLFIDLHKESSIKESINYDDKFIDNYTFQWQTPNSTKQDSERGKNIIDNKKRNINLHLFIRKYKKIDNVVQPYIYIGKGNTISYSGNQPITTIIRLQNKIPNSLYTEFITKT